MIIDCWDYIEQPQYDVNIIHDIRPISSSSRLIGVKLREQCTNLFDPNMNSIQDLIRISMRQHYYEWDTILQPLADTPPRKRLEWK